MTSRAVHIQRFYNVNEDDFSTNKDCWMDVAIIDNRFISTSSGWKYKRSSFTPAFLNGANPARTTWPKRVLSPNEQDTGDPTIYVDLPVLIASGWSTGSGDRRRIHTWGPGTNESRTYWRRRVIHYEIDVSTATTQGLNDPAHPEIGPAWYSVTDYLEALSAPDPSDYIDVEVTVITRLAVQSGSRFKSGMLSLGDNAYDMLLRDPLRPDLISSVPAESPDYYPGKFDPPWRLDPFMNIVNIGTGQATEFEFRP